MSTLTLILLGLLIVLQVGDIYTTHRVLSQGGRELNPLLAELFGIYGHKPVLLVWKGAVVWVLVWAVQRNEMPDWLLAVLAALYTFVVWRNWRQIKRDA